MANAEQTALSKQVELTTIVTTETEQIDIKSMIYVVRNQQVILDSDLAMLYQVDTKVFNQAVKRNIARFPDNFRFQLAKEEYAALRSQDVTLNENVGRGTHRKYLPYVFTKQGIAMLSAILGSDVAIQVSINIMNALLMNEIFEKNTIYKH